MAESTTVGGDQRRILLLITGTGRSGTSTMAGTLFHLGLSVPGPYLGANRTNPKGFFEPKWSVQFHRGIHKRARINDFDGRFDAPELVRAATTQQARDELDAWLAEHDGDQLVVKDPRTVWHHDTWVDACARTGRSPRYVSMLRHPAEVVGSRATYYADRVDDLTARRYEICNVGRWVTSSLVSERQTRGHRRAFVRYADLLDDWRAVAVRLRDELGLAYPAGLARNDGHPVDDFVDPSLRRVRVGWDDLDVPKELRSIAQETWENLCVLADHGGVDERASEALDDVRERYGRLLEASHALSYDAVHAAAAQGRAQGARRARRRLRRQENARP